MSKVIETDSRGRISLKKLGVEGHSHYQVSVLEGGNVLLEPVTFRTALEETLDNALPSVRDAISEHQSDGYPTAEQGKTALAALLADD